MSNDAVAEILRRAAAEPEFHNLLFRNSVQALAGYDLTSEEQLAFGNLTPEAFSALASDLERRISLGIVWGDILGPGL